MEDKTKYLIQGGFSGAWGATIAFAIYFYMVSVWGIRTAAEFVESIYLLPVILLILYICVYVIPLSLKELKPN